jgi:plasmid stabilization system protein ParE
LRTLVWTHPARRDLYGIAAYYKQITPTLALDMLDRIETSPLILLEYPEMGSPTRRRGIRKWRAARTPFVLLYAVSRDYVEVRRVIHDAMDQRQLPS